MSEMKAVIRTDGWLIHEDPTLKTFWNFVQGPGEFLMNEVILYAEDHRMMISLETHNPANVPIYEHFGFKVYGVLEKPHFDLKQYWMIREILYLEKGKMRLKLNMEEITTQGQVLAFVEPGALSDQGFF